jgi:hypothetical protein
MSNHLDQLHKDRKLIQTLYTDGVNWEDLLNYFAGRYTRSEIMGFVAGQTRQWPDARCRSVADLLHTYRQFGDERAEAELTSHPAVHHLQTVSESSVQRAGR